MNEQLQDQYEAYPYPYRDSTQEAVRNTKTVMNDLNLISHFLTGGVYGYHESYQALVAGGGTGDATVHLARQLAQVQPKARVVHIDLSAKAIHIARKRIQSLNLSNVHFEQISLLDLQPGKFGLFDYINCSGVLHHLESAEAGSIALARLLKPSGGLSIMLYGALGRRGIYDVQKMMRTIRRDNDNLEDLIPLTRRLLLRLPEENPYRLKPGFSPVIDDAELVDKFLHVRDRPYTVSDVLQLLRASGLKLQSFIPPASYDPLTINLGPAWKCRLEALSYEDRLCFGELLFGNISKHFFFASKDKNNDCAPPDPNDQTFIPILRREGRLMQKRYQCGSLSAFHLTKLAPHGVPQECFRFLSYIDGKKSLEEIFNEMHETEHVSVNSLKHYWIDFYRLLNSTVSLVLNKSIY